MRGVGEVHASSSQTSQPIQVSVVRTFGANLLRRLAECGPRLGAFIGLHGSWNRKPRSGYQVIFVPFTDGHPSGSPRDALSGFVSAQDEAYGRPVGVVTGADGGLLVADDVGNTVWRVTPAR